MTTSLVSEPQIDNSRKTDLREQLYNDGETGPVQRIQVSAERVVQLRGILFDIDLKLLRCSPLLPGIPTAPSEFYHGVLRDWLDRHPILQHAEVRDSGNGVHVLLWFCEPIVFTTDGERERWDGIIKVVQAALPVDPDQPAITAVTRPIGSINSKNGATVSELKQGNPITRDDLLILYEQMCSSPFGTVFNIVVGEEQISPCPVCCRDGSSLRVGRHFGFCYGGCRRVKLEQLYDLLLVTRDMSHGTEVADHDQSSQ